MRLSDFIESNREPILKEWETFARSLGPASEGMDIDALRDHANEMLTVIADDLNTPQGAKAKAEKSKGNAPAPDPEITTAAEDHGSERAESGFSVEQMISEYRALRASVIRLWTKGEGRELEACDVEDLTRFNEAIDQALAESIARFSQDLNSSKEMFLAMLGHDLRTPIGAVLTSAQFMLDTNELQEPNLTLTRRIAISSNRMVKMVGDLLDFTRSRLGGGIPIVRTELSMQDVVREVVEEVAAAHPNGKIDLKVGGGQRGSWDGARISQMLTNLMGNALEHGNANSPVSVSIDGTSDEVKVSIHNEGPPIPADLLNGIFDPMKVREKTSSAAIGPAGSLGLGLYIAERIAHAHKGSITVKSSATAGTTFTVHLPRC